jgi:hypothetical protein
MCERCRQADQAHFFVDRGGLHHRDLMAAERFAHDLETARECGVAKRLIRLARPGGANDRNQQLLGIGKFSLRLGEGSGDRADCLDRSITVVLSAEIEADRAGLRTFGANAVAARLLGVLWYRSFER